MLERLNLDEDGALFSKNRKYRYGLWRVWDINKPTVMFIGLNPSTANETKDDPTIRRVKKFAKDWGYGRVFMLNCFPYVSTNPKDMVNASKDAFEFNDDLLCAISTLCDKTIFAWGNFDIVIKLGRDIELIDMFPEAEALVINKNGSPRHPLYVKASVQPVRISSNGNLD